ncbi:MAG TPA: HEAT repeat domain-containing protein [Gemmataceae bacterium]|nr:HEAT repeat domain-containing protein [Gemmataceae bacterium]
MRAIGLCLLTAIAALADPKPGDEGTPEHSKAAALVKQLGDKRYATREAAAKQLIEMGPAAVPALTAGTKSEDEEVRNRSIALLPQAKAAEWKRRAEAYRKDEDGKLKHNLPLLTAWEKLTGKPDAGSRKMFAEMIRTNGELLELAATDPTRASEAVKAKCRTMGSQATAVTKQVSAEPGDLAALFFVHGRVGKNRADWRSLDHPAYLLANPGLSDAIASKEIGGAIRRVLVHWAESRPTDDMTSQQYFVLTVMKSPFPEAVPVLTRLAQDKNASGLHARAIAIEALGKVGDADAKAALEGLMSDSTSLLQGIAGKDFPVSDCAFAALVTAHGKKPADYGVTGGITIAFRAGAQAEIVRLTVQTFPNSDARQTGLKKWKEETGKK